MQIIPPGWWTFAVPNQTDNQLRPTAALCIISQAEMVVMYTLSVSIILPVVFYLLGGKVCHKYMTHAKCMRLNINMTQLPRHIRYQIFIKYAMEKYWESQPCPKAIHISDIASEWRGFWRRIERWARWLHPIKMWGTTRKLLQTSFRPDLVTNL